ncbi:MAG: hypothetical protein OXG84_07045 [Chloroflexi bacterium]|nr:hypothetical protein [Chloroflexota bacterium]
MALANVCSSVILIQNMENASPHKAKATELELILDRWERRYEWRLLSRTVPRSLIAALLISLAIGAVGYLRFRLAAEQLALIAAGLCALGGILNLLYTLVFPRSLAEKACYFDIEFGLRERVSTAFELMRGRIKSHPEIEARQIADALAHARAIEPSKRIAMDFRPRELGALAVLLIAMIGMILLPAIVGEDFTLDPPSAAVEGAKEDLREMIETIAKDTDLDEIDRQDLLEALEIALERLEEEDISEEEAFAAMSQLQAELEALENELEDTIDLDQSATEAALEALNDFIAPSDTGEQSAESASETDATSDLGELLEGLEQMNQDAAQMTAEEAQAAAEALQRAAEYMERLSEEMAEQMEMLAQALENADLESLQEQMDALREQIQEEQRQQQTDQNARMMLQEQSELAQEAAEEIAQEQAEEGRPQMGDPGPSQQEGAEPGQRAGQPSDQQSSEGQEGANRGVRPADRNRPGAAENQGRNQDSRSAGGGAGEGAPSNVSLPGSGGEDQGAETNNRTTGMGEIQYETIYSPSGIDGGGDNEIRLRTDPGDTTVAEGEFDDNPLGESRVSYDTVFSEYQNAANRALESDYVPLGLRDVVREYFTSLEPSAQG